MKLVIPIAIAASLMASDAFAAAAFSAGPGATACKDFTAVFARDREGATNMYLSWAQGVMTTLNLVSMSNGQAWCDIGTGIADQFDMIRLYCTSHPDAGFLDAVTQVYRQLPVQSKRCADPTYR